MPPPEPALAARRLDVPVTRREIFGWAMFDFANSSYTTVVITLAYGKFFVSHIVPDGSRFANSYWSLAIILSTLLALVLSPLAGAVIDASGRKKRALVLSAVACAGATALLAVAGPGDVWLAIALLVVSNAAFMLGEAFCASFLPDIATPESMGKVSGLGWGIGYFGGLLSAAMTLLVIVQSDPARDPAGYVRENQLAMVAIGAFFLLAAIPTFALLRNRALPMPGFERASLGQLVRRGAAQLRDSAALARRQPALFRFLIAFMVYMAGLDAIVKFVGIYSEQEVRLDSSELVTLFLVLQICAAAGAFGFGWLEGVIGPKRTVLLTLFWWIVGVLGIYFLEPLAGLFGTGPKQVFYLLAVIAGAGIGATQASSRTVVGLLAPPERVAETFGFWGMFSRAGSILGAIGFGLVSDLASRRTAVLVVAAFFVVGALLLFRVEIGNREKGTGNGERGTGKR